MKSYANATNLKYFAVILMVLDHIHQMFYEFGAPIWLTALGRLVFPIFLFLFADSFYYTRSKKINYSSIAYELANEHRKLCYWKLI